MAELERNATGVPIDPVDGDPVFTVVDGVPYSRRRWLAAEPDRRAAQAAEFRKIATKNRTQQEK